MKKNINLLLLLIVFIFFGACAQEGKNDSATTKNTSNTNSNNSHATGPVKWITMEELEARMKEEPRKVVVDLYTDWCGWCKRMDANTFSNETLAEYLNQKFYAVKFNAETDKTISFKGEMYEPIPGGRRATNKLTYKLILGDQANGRVGYPTFAFLDENLNRIDAYPGYKDASAFDALAHFIAENHYKNTKFTDFLQNFKSNISSTAQPGQSRTPLIPQQGIKVKRQS